MSFDVIEKKRRCAVGGFPQVFVPEDTWMDTRGRHIRNVAEDEMAGGRWSGSGGGFSCGGKIESAGWFWRVWAYICGGLGAFAGGVW